jgi:ligand-binding sensor domain-containing protein
MRTAILFLVIVLIGVDLFSQHPTYINYTTEGGLPSNDVYHVIQDRQGYLWFATDNGASRFDGRNFTNFTTNDGLTDNTVLELYEDYKGRIWFIPFSCRLCYFEDNAIHQYEFNDTIAKNFTNGFKTIKQQFFVSSKDEVYIHSQGNGLLAINESGYCKRLTKGSTQCYKVSFIKQELRDTLSLVHLYYNDSNFIYNDGVSSIEDSVSHVLMPDFYSGRRHLIEYSDGFRLVSKNPLIIILKEQDIVRISNFSEEIIWLSSTEENNLWVCLANRGIIYYDDIINKPEEYVNYFDGKTFTSVIEDHESGV